MVPFDVMTGRNSMVCNSRGVADLCKSFEMLGLPVKKRRLHDRKSEHFKALTQVGHASAVVQTILFLPVSIKWDHFEILATGKSDLQCKIKETLLISDLKPSLNENVGSEKLFLY